MGEVVVKSFKGRVVDCGEATHFACTIYRLRPSLLASSAIPKSLWPQTERDLDPGQLEVQARLSIIHGNVFPT